MEEYEKVVQLNATNNTAKDVLAIMGSTVKMTYTVWDEDDIEIEYEFEGRKGKTTIGLMGNNSIGACVGLFNDAEDNTKLIGVFNYGDDGNYEAVIDDQQRNNLVRISDI